MNFNQRLVFQTNIQGRSVCSLRSIPWNWTLIWEVKPNQRGILILSILVKLDWNSFQSSNILSGTTSSQSICSNQIRCIIIFSIITQGKSVVNLYQIISAEEFYQCASIDVILGMDIYNRLVLPGTMSKTGQPDATNTVFGYVVSGAFFK